VPARPRASNFVQFVPHTWNQVDKFPSALLPAEVAEALAHAHERGVVHRDVKAANVLLGLDGEARLADFGIARLLEDEAQRLTDTGTIAGTLRYLAPEQLRGEPAGPPADVYAVGVLLTEMVSGQPPYQVSSPVALAEAQRTPPMMIEGAPPSLSAIMRPTLDPDPARRPSSAGALAAELRGWLETNAAPGAVDSARDEPTLPAIPLPAAPSVPPVPPASPSSPIAAAHAGSGPAARDPRPRRLALVPAVVIAAVGMFVALVLLLAAVTVRDGPGSSPSPTASATPSPSPSATASPTPAPAPLTLSEAIDAFRDLVDSGEEEGEIESDAVRDLQDLADEIASALEDGTQGEVNRAFRELRRGIEAFEQDGGIGSADMAARLQDAVDEIEAAAAR